MTKKHANGVDDVKAVLGAPRGIDPVLQATDLLSTGSTLVDLACTGRPGGGLPKGKFVLLVGDSDSGKTFLSLTCFAEALLNPAFKHYRLIFDDPEDGAMMDKAAFFGKAVEKRIEPPAGTRKDPRCSETVEQFYYNVDDALKDGRPFIYVLDSEDALTAEADDDKFEKKKRAARKGKDDESGSYGMAKAKFHSGNLRRLRNRLKASGSIVIMIKQTRQRTGPGSTYDPTTFSGGKALKFYADLLLWTSLKQTLKRPHKGKDRQVGILVKIAVKKNRVNGRKRSVEVPVYWSTGIDNTGSCVAYLVAEGHWKKHRGEVNAPEFGFVGDEESLIKHIEDTNGELELRTLVGDVWADIERATRVERKRRYT